jgi:Zn-dependent protease with chaperone function
MTITLVLLAYAAAVAALAPRLMTGWVYRSPRLGLLIIHAAALSVLVAVLLAGVACVASPGRLHECLVALTGRSTAALPAAVIIGFAVPFFLAARLVRVGIGLNRRRRVTRSRHGELLRLVGYDDPALGATVVEADQPTAYCLPGAGRIVVSTGALRLLSPPQLDAVLAHERAHLSGRHHLLSAWAGLLATAFPQPQLFGELQRLTAELVELIADDTAARADHGDGLVEALGVLAASMAPRGSVPGLAVTGGRVLTRVQRLLEPPPPLSAAGRVGGTGLAASVIAVPIVLAVIPAGLAACPLLFG